LLTAKNPGDRPSAKQALQHPFFAQTLLNEERARQVLSGDIAVTPGFDQLAFDKTMAEAVKHKKIGAEESRDAIAKASGLLRELGQLPTEFEKLSGGQDAKLKAVERASKLLEELLAVLKELSTGATGVLKGFLDGMLKEASKRKKDVDVSKHGPRHPIQREKVVERKEKVASAPPKT
jgi:hypothetical protein